MPVTALVVQGLAQPAQDPESTRHANVEAPSLDENVNVGVMSVVVPLGPESIVVFGAVVSAGGAVATTVIAFIVLLVSPSASVTTRRTFLTPRPGR